MEWLLLVAEPLVVFLEVFLLPVLQVHTLQKTERVLQVELKLVLVIQAEQVQEQESLAVLIQLPVGRVALPVQCRSFHKKLPRQCFQNCILGMGLSLMIEVWLLEQALELELVVLLEPAGCHNYRRILLLG